jgi:cyclic pyranopterin monophosphate synthase
MNTLSHFDSSGHSHMVDVGHKPETERVAVALGLVRMRPETLALILDRKLAKGDVLEVARLAGIMGAKKTSDLIPLCHPLPLTNIHLEITPKGPNLLEIRATVKTFGRTGVEMEALSAVSIAALTVYDMAKAVDRGMTIESIRLDAKSGGASGDFQRADSARP